MSSSLLALLRTEERRLLAELRATPTFQKLEAVRRVLGLYSGTDPDGEAPAEDLLLGRAEAAGTSPEPREREPTPPSWSGAAAEEGRTAVPSPFLTESRRGTTSAPPSGPPPRATPAALATAVPNAAPANASDSAPALSRLAVATPSGEPVVRDGSRAVSAVRAALLSITR